MRSYCLFTRGRMYVEINQTHTSHSAVNESLEQRHEYIRNMSELLPHTVWLLLRFLSPQHASMFISSLIQQTESWKLKKKKNEFNSQLLHLRFKCDSISGGFIYVAISQLSLVLNNRGVRTVRLQTWPVWTKQMGKMKWLAQCKLPSNLWTVSNFHNTFCLALHGVLGGVLRSKRHG